MTLTLLSNARTRVKERRNMTTVALTMILKNEAHIIERCLASVKPFIDYWTICDTGSTDGTQDVVRKVLDGVPGELHDVPWEGYGPSRTRGLDLAVGKADYALVLDADEIVCAVPEDKEKAFEKNLEAYSIWISMVRSRWSQCRFFRLLDPTTGKSRGWRYRGVLHEFPTCDGNWKHEKIEGFQISSPRDGSRSTVNAKEKFMGDVLLLLEALKTEKDVALRTRYVFYLAQSYRDAGSRGGGPEDELAIKHYLERADMGAGLNWEEVYVSLVEAGRAQARLRRGDEALKTFYRAYWHWPARIEATRELAAMFKYRVDHNPKHGTLFIEH